MNLPSKIPSLADECREKRIALLEAFCALEMELAEALGRDAPKMFSQKIGRLSVAQLAGLDSKSFIASRNLVAHAHVVAASRAGMSICVWQVPHHEQQLNARVMSRAELAEWFDTVSAEIAKLRSSISGNV